MSNETFLLDVNVFLALLSENHVHHQLVTMWFNAGQLQWATCLLTEAGFIRNATAPRVGQVTMVEATALLNGIKEHPGYTYLPITTDWRGLCGTFFSRIHGTKQVTDACLLGVAVQHRCTLATMDKAIVHLAGDTYAGHVLWLGNR